MGDIRQQKKQLVDIYKNTVYRYRRKYLIGELSIERYIDWYRFSIESLIALDYTITTAHHYLFSAEKQADRELKALWMNANDPSAKIGLHKRIAIDKKEAEARRNSFQTIDAKK
ncbi:hypothetical protein [Bacillus marinisedimentorum]|uniref:hypothetical protein n=1 Tax=Bacillus marinisedimentorum TaxID=1821260 RepID=UPI0007E1B997|nr:hypothetical protein [Bacillus marinisedimentorum]